MEFFFGAGMAVWYGHDNVSNVSSILWEGVWSVGWKEAKDREALLLLMSSTLRLQ